MCRRHRQAAFTLIELLIVLVIIGITVSFAVLSIGLNNEADRVETEARRLVALMQLASDEAVLSSKQLALQIDSDRYRFISLHGTEWRPVEGDAVFRERRMPEESRLLLKIEGEQILSGENPGALIYFLSSGEISPFDLVLSTSDDRHKFHVKGAIHGRIDYLGEQPL
jgi:general secretion pathway protein H